MKNLNSKQKSAVEAPINRPLLIVAGAGTGKTHTLTSRLAYLIESGVYPAKIIAITFTNKAAKEMLERISRKLPPGNKTKPFIGTFHSLGARILRMETKLLGRSSGFTIFDADDSSRLIKKIYKSFYKKEEQKNGPGPAFFAAKISEIKDGAAETGRKTFSDPHSQLVPEFFKIYESALAKNNAFDFDDLIEKPVDIFRRYPDVLKKYQNKFTHILVDEYQDLNNKQYEFIKLLAGESANLTVVGDDQQMIYGWRHANIGIFLDFEKDWPGANIVLLEENYRSTKNIIAAASAAIKNNEYQRPKNLWTENEEGKLVKIIETGGEDEEAEWIAEQVDLLIGESTDSNKKIQNQSANTAVLYRTNAQSRALEQALIEKNIPYRIYGGVKFYERREIKDIVAALRIISNPADQISRERLEKNISKTRLVTFLNALPKKSSQQTNNPLRLINIFLKSAGYVDYLEKYFPNAPERMENMVELARFAEKFENLESFLEEVALVQQTDDGVKKGQEENDFPVNLMTIHLAKGLEFDNVFLAGCNEGILPHSRSMGSQKESEEERRLFYVAATRARKELTISFYDLPSRFISEIPTDFAEFKSLISESTSLDDLNDEEKYISLD